MTADELEAIRERAANWQAQDPLPPADLCTDRLDLLDEVDRLKAGRFTPEEFDALCHCLSEEDACRFKQGCEEYQRRLFGKGAVEEERQRCLLIVAATSPRGLWELKQDITRKIREGK
jgi:hypothetical protein